MSFPLKVICLALLFSPVLVVVSTLSGSVTNVINSSNTLGDASNLFELALVFVVSIPSFVCGVYVLLRKKAAFILFPISYIVICVSPLLLSSVRSDLDSFKLNLLSALLVGVIVSGYLYFSRDVREYFLGKYVGHRSSQQD